VFRDKDWEHVTSCNEAETNAQDKKHQKFKIKWVPNATGCTPKLLPKLRSVQDF